ncbi:MAG: Fic family protein [Coxiellaceae bacterium]|nr:Fic family protein [Coxiellaceae bacterium]
MKWLWQLKKWPAFIYDAGQLGNLEKQFYELLGEQAGSSKLLNQQLLTIDLLCDEAIKTSKIENEQLNHDSLQSSLKKRLGLINTKQHIPPAEAGISEMMVDNLENYQQPLSADTLCHWNMLLTNHRWDLTDIGIYRTHQEAMEIVSGAIGKTTTHYEAPPSKQMNKEMQRYIEWYNQADLPPLLHAAISHVYFLAIHPFEDGNGRIARALTIKLLSQHVDKPLLIMLSSVIEANKKDYYQALASTNHSLDINQWLQYFTKTIIAAQQRTQAFIDLLIMKSKLLKKYEKQLNPRQIKVIKRLFEAGVDGFVSGLSARNYMTITDTAPSTATRDLQHLVELKILQRKGQLKATRYYLNQTGSC